MSADDLAQTQALKLVRLHGCLDGLLALERLMLEGHAVNNRVAEIIEGHDPKDGRSFVLALVEANTMLLHHQADLRANYVLALDQVQAMTEATKANLHGRMN